MRNLRRKKRPGQELETTVFTALNEAIQKGILGFQVKHCQVFQKKGYYSRDRNRQIITDVSMEIYLPNQDVPSIIWVWECKDYRHPVPVDDVEEFHAKLDQIGADKTKGTIVSRGAFQRGAVDYARSKGIGVARLLSPKQTPRPREPLWTRFLWKCACRRFPTEEELREKVTQALTKSDFFEAITGRGKDSRLYSLTTLGRGVPASGLLHYLFAEVSDWDLINWELESNKQPNRE